MDKHVWASADVLPAGEGVNFSQFCAVGFYVRPLTNNLDL